RGGLGDRAALGLERHVGDTVAVHLEPERELIATGWIARFDAPVRILDLPEIARLPVVVQDQFLVQRILGGHGASPRSVGVRGSGRASSAPVLRAPRRS